MLVLYFPVVSMNFRWALLSLQLWHWICDKYYPYLWKKKWSLKEVASCEGAWLNPDLKSPNWEQCIHYIAVKLSSSDTVIGKKNTFQYHILMEAVLLSDRDVPWNVECSPPLSTLGSSCSLAALRWPLQHSEEEAKALGQVERSCRGCRCGPLPSTNLNRRGAWCLKKPSSQTFSLQPKTSSKKTDHMVGVKDC